MYDMSTVSFEGEPESPSWPPPPMPQSYEFDPAYQNAFYHTYQATPAYPDTSLNSYTGGGYDFPDVNSLEPSLFQYPAQQHHASPTGSSSHTSASDENEDYHGWHPYKKSSPLAAVEEKPKGKGGKGKKRKPKRDPNEPQKPVSAYALFFRDTQAAIKGQNPNASFGEVSKIVASMWDTLDTDAKNAYKLKTETAKKDYLKQLAAYRANLISRSGLPMGMPTIKLEAYKLKTETAKKDYLKQLAAYRANLISRSGLPMGTMLEGQEMMQQTAQSSPDSTTPTPQLEPGRPPTCDVGEKSLASLIAEPTARHVLTATTTLTVPTSYVPGHSHFTDFKSRGSAKASCAESEGGNPGGEQEQGPWNEFAPNQSLLHHCRDVFSIWGPGASSGVPGPPEFAQ